MLDRGPQLEARKRRLNEIHIARDAFGAHMLRLISTCSQLQAAQLATDEMPDWTPVLRCLPDVSLKYSKSVGAP